MKETEEVMTVEELSALYEKAIEEFGINFEDGD